MNPSYFSQPHVLPQVQQMNPTQNQGFMCHVQGPQASLSRTDNAFYYTQNQINQYDTGSSNLNEIKQPSSLSQLRQHECGLRETKIEAAGRQNSASSQPLSTPAQADASKLGSNAPSQDDASCTHQSLSTPTYLSSLHQGPLPDFQKISDMPQNSTRVTLNTHLSGLPSFNTNNFDNFLTKLESQHHRDDEMFQECDLVNYGSANTSSVKTDAQTLQQRNSEQILQIQQVIQDTDSESDESNEPLPRTLRTSTRSKVNFSRLNDEEKVHRLQKMATKIKKLKQRIRSLKSYRTKKLQSLIARQMSINQSQNPNHLAPTSLQQFSEHSPQASSEMSGVQTNGVGIHRQSIQENFPSNVIQPAFRPQYVQQQSNPSATFIQPPEAQIQAPSTKFTLNLSKLQTFQPKFARYSLQNPLSQVGVVSQTGLGVAADLSSQQRSFLHVHKHTPFHQKIQRLSNSQFIHQNQSMNGINQPTGFKRCQHQIQHLMPQETHVPNQNVSIQGIQRQIINPTPQFQIANYQLMRGNSFLNIKQVPTISAPISNNQNSLNPPHQAPPMSFGIVPENHFQIKQNYQGGAPEQLTQLSSLQGCNMNPADAKVITPLLHQASYTPSAQLQSGAFPTHNSQVCQMGMQPPIERETSKQVINAANCTQNQVHLHHEDSNSQAILRGADMCPQIQDPPNLIFGLQSPESLSESFPS